MIKLRQWVLHHPYEDGTWRGIEKCSHDEVGSLRVFSSEEEALEHHKNRDMPEYMKPWEIQLQIPGIGDEKTYTFEVNENQLHVLRAALDNYARMGMGQLDVSVAEFLRNKFYDDSWDEQLDPVYERVTKRNKVDQLVNRLKDLIFGHPPNGSWGISNEKVPKDCREAYDIRQIVGHALNGVRKAQGKKPWYIDGRPYLATNDEDPPIKITEN